MNTTAQRPPLGAEERDNDCADFRTDLSYKLRLNFKPGISADGICKIGR